jgi:uncharacterized membrane protein YjdF
MVLVMKKRDLAIIYIISLAVYIIIGAYNLSKNSQWIFDVYVSLAFVTLVWFFSERLKLGKLSFTLLNIALLSHLLGSFDFYALNIWIWEYDNLVHILSSIVAAYIIFNYINEKLCEKKIDVNLIKEHKFIFLFLVIASVSALGTAIELLEYAGFMFLGQGDGLFFAGTGDYGKLGTPETQYIDTMSDIFVNTIGSIIGAVSYFLISFNKKKKCDQPKGKILLQ